jgi:hypothetical protein
LRFHVADAFELGQATVKDADQASQFFFEGFKAGGNRHDQFLLRIRESCNSITQK